ncbi:hypothetical protein AAFA46_07635 [Oscillospiraceae bacterium WX1]
MSEILLRPSGGDDTTAINNAIVTASTNGTGTVRLSGNFIVSSPAYNDAITMRSNVTLQGDPGSTITYTTANSQGYQIIGIGIGIANVKIDGLHIVGDRDTNTGGSGEWGHGVVIKGATDVTISNMFIEKTWGDGIYICGDGGSPTNNPAKRIIVEHIRMYKTSRNGITISSANNLIIRDLYVEASDRTLPKSAVDIETNAAGEQWTDILIENVHSNLCPGGVSIMPTASGSTNMDISIKFNDLMITGNDTRDTGNLSMADFDETKHTGYIDITNLTVATTIWPVAIESVHVGGVRITIDRLDLKTEIVYADSTLSHQCVLWIASADQTSKNIGDIKITNLRHTGTAKYLASIVPQNSGTIETSGFRIVNLLNKQSIPLYVDGTIHNVFDQTENVSVSMKALSDTYNPGCGWFTNHFHSPKYTNEGMTADAVLDGPINMSDTPIIIENVSPTYKFGYTRSGKTFLPAYLGFVDGLRTSKQGSRVTLKQIDANTIEILNLVGDWYSYTSNSALSPTTGAIAVTMNGTLKTLTPTGNCTLTATGGTLNQTMRFEITTSGTTSRTITFGTGFKAQGTLSTGTVSGKQFTVTFFYDGTIWVEQGRTAAM